MESYFFFNLIFISSLNPLEKAEPIKKFPRKKKLETVDSRNVYFFFNFTKLINFQRKLIPLKVKGITKLKSVSINNGKLIHIYK